MKALMLIDIQNGLTKRDLYNKDLFIQTVNDAIEKYRSTSNIIVFVQHENKQLINGSDDWTLDNSLLAEPSDKIFSKQKGDAFTNKELIEYFKSNDVTHVVVGGLVTHGCIKHTCLGSIKNGFETSLLKDGHTNWAKDAEDRIAAVEKTLQDAGVSIVATNNL